jgi:hypothetical protein
MLRKACFTSGTPGGVKSSPPDVVSAVQARKNGAKGTPPALTGRGRFWVIWLISRFFAGIASFIPSFNNQLPIYLFSTYGAAYFH